MLCTGFDNWGNWGSFWAVFSAFIQRIESTYMLILLPLQCLKLFDQRTCISRILMHITRTSVADVSWSCQAFLNHQEFTSIYGHKSEHYYTYMLVEIPMARDMFSKVDKLIQLYLTIPVTTCMLRGVSHLFGIWKVTWGLSCQKNVWTTICFLGMPIKKKQIPSTLLKWLIHLCLLIEWELIILEYTELCLCCECTLY